jgi:hypothetical protein
MTTKAEHQKRTARKRREGKKRAAWRRAKDSLAVAKYGEGEPEPAVIKKPNGREICTKTPEGKAEYWERTKLMAIRQSWLCGCGCGTRLWYSVDPIKETNMTFEHENGRGAAKQDDRILRPDGSWMNACFNYLCNGRKGSRRIPYAAHATNLAPPEAQ